jgi:CheY-like chemotaxis protein
MYGSVQSNPNGTAKMPYLKLVKGPAMERNGAARLNRETFLDPWGRLERFLAADITRPPSPTVQPASMSAQIVPDAAGPQVLVAEDNPSLQVLTCKILTGLGVRPHLAANGAEAVALACANEFDLILMDLQMPVLDGFGATRRIRRFERDNARARVPVVAYTSCPYSPTEPFLLDFGIDTVLMKPCTLQALQECLLSWIPPGRAAGIRGAVDRRAPSRRT